MGKESTTRVLRGPRDCLALECARGRPLVTEFCLRHWESLPSVLQQAIETERCDPPTPCYLMVRAMCIASLARYDGLLDDAAMHLFVRTVRDTLGGIVPADQQMRLSEYATALRMSTGKAAD